MAPIEYYQRLLSALNPKEAVPHSTGIEGVGDFLGEDVGFTQTAIELLAKHIAGESQLRYHLQKQILTDSFELIAESLIQLSKVQNFVLRSFDTGELDVEFGVGVFPLGVVNAACTAITEGAEYFIVFDPDIFSMIEISTKMVMLDDARSAGFLRKDISREHVSALSFEYFAHLHGMDDSARYVPNSLGVVDPVRLVSGDGGVEFFSSVARRAFDFVLYHEWGHIFSGRLTEKFPKNFDFDNLKRGGISISAETDLSVWSNELWADRISVVALAAQINEMHADSRTGLLQATVVGIAVFLAYAEFVETVSGTDQSYLIETQGRRIVSLHPRCAHPPAGFRLACILDYLQGSLEVPAELVDAAFHYIFSFNGFWELGASLSAASRQKLIDEMILLVDE